MKKINIPITASISGYSLILSILKYLEFGISNVLWLLILIFILSFGWTLYSTYRDNKTIFGLSIDKGVIGGLLVTYFYPLINVDDVAISSIIAFISGVYLIIGFVAFSFLMTIFSFFSFFRMIPFFSVFRLRFRGACIKVDFAGNF